MYGGIGVSASSLHRESTDSLILRKDFPMPFCVGLELGLQKWLSHNTIASLQFSEKLRKEIMCYIREDFMSADFPLLS